MPKDDGVLMEGVQLIYRNFAGKERQFNRQGDRNFAVLLDEDVAETMLADGWNVKRQRVHDDEREENPDAIGRAYLQVKIKFDGPKPPKVFMISSRGKTGLEEDTVEQLDFVDLQNVDLIIGPYHYDVQGSQGIAAYLRSMYATIEEDELDLKYADLGEQ